MYYDTEVVEGRFLSRPNRFIAHIEINGEQEICHVKNTGRCKELLPYGAKVWCSVSSNPTRKTKYDLIVVEKNGFLVNMDSQSPNQAAKEWLSSGGLGTIHDLRSETVHGDSRFDFSFMKDGKQCFLEVKGVTLENCGICSFPDAPTERGTKHLKGLTQAVIDGFGAYVLFVIQMEGMKYLMPNRKTDPKFSEALRKAAENGVNVLAMECHITPNSMQITKNVAVQLD